MLTLSLARQYLRASPCTEIGVILSQQLPSGH
jgi:hypothetical protein